ncbi:uncharacterized protein SAMN00777080_1287 [Aquiflexum balticum DSM 16537]|uniref:DUF418 domain-containing protein n=1 Tax=Aquiflexum balticum DSM 16537 TaxID=758820 RepID=A0A1W2H1A6_9BACT|nr:DUF418 domain-containing protein [Aquiflexum balticum]SMD42725.1 uncharacterized protein SAMN00777080_1287 [Aquiflexum balticum DSM 16537]
MKQVVKNRIHAVDALRGFALAGIVIAHVLEQFLAGFPTDEMRAVMFSGPVDYIVDTVSFWIIRGKFFALFSLLFGLSFFIQMDNAEKSGVHYKTRYLWRLLVLLVIGVAHNSFYSGDILVIYVLFGFLLIPFHSVSNKVVLALAVILFLGGGRFLSYGIFGNESIIALNIENFDEKYMAAITGGSLFEVWRMNFISMIGKFNFQMGVLGRGYLTFAFFLLGMWIGRTRLLENLQSNTTVLKKIILWSFVGTLAMIPLFWYLFSQMESIFDFTSWWSMFALSAYDNFNFFFTIFLAAGFVYLFELPKMQKTLSWLAPYGRMALTNYVFQSLIGTFLFFNWGLGYMGQLRNIELLLIAFLIIGAQMIISFYWMKKFKYGPIEWLWRSLTYLKVQPFIISQPIPVVIKEKLD